MGGVVEHPHDSKLWKYLNLPTGTNFDIYNGYSVSINQSWFGHKAEKKTLLYIVGCKPANLPIIPIKFDLIEYVVSSSIRKGSPGWKPEISRKEREETPIQLAKWLVETASKCETTFRPGN